MLRSDNLWQTKAIIGTRATESALNAKRTMPHPITLCAMSAEKNGTLREERKTKIQNTKIGKNNITKRIKKKCLKMVFAPCAANHFIRGIKPATNTGSKTERDGKGMKKTIVEQ